MRCPPSKRRDEIAAVIAHAEASQALLATQRSGLGASATPTVIAGDFNQPNTWDYPPEEWAAIEADMARAGLPASDGVMQVMRDGGYLPSFEAATIRNAIPATTAWNGAVVDYCYVNDPARPAGVGMGAGKSLAVEASYAYYTLASDHLPLVTDFKLV